MDIAKLEKQIREGKGTFSILHKLSEASGLDLADSIIKKLNNDYPGGEISAEDARAILHPSLIRNHLFISEMTAAVINTMYQKAKIGIKAISPEYNIARENDLVTEVVDGTYTREGFAVFPMKVKDSSIRENAFASQNVGLETRVTRTYDGVGIHDGKDTCEWCLSRCGDNMTLSEAYAKGAFERHPGCGCELLYTTYKGTQRQTDWTTNTWTRIRR